MGSSWWLTVGVVRRGFTMVGGNGEELGEVAVRVSGGIVRVRSGLSLLLKFILLCLLLFFFFQFLEYFIFLKFFYVRVL